MIPNIYQLAMADSDVVAASGGRFFKSGHAPQNVVSPYAVWSFVFGDPADSLAEAPAAERFVVQIDCWGATVPDVDSLYVALRTCFERLAYVTMIADQRDPGTGRFRKSMQVAYWQLRT